MQRYEQIAHCPRCGDPYGPDSFLASEIAFQCSRCSYVFYQNSVPSASILIPSASIPGQVLLMTRATEPEVGKVALPGGFLRYGEDPAEGARREAREETLLDVAIDRLLVSFLLDYCYLGVQLSVLELSFLAYPIGIDLTGLHTSEACLLAFYPVAEVLMEPNRLAFPEQTRVLACYLEKLARGSAASGVTEQELKNAILF
jgi:8-oxo-dGTP pyrophosphatase MutT (NUDIX family)